LPSGLTRGSERLPSGLTRGRRTDRVGQGLSLIEREASRDGTEDRSGRTAAGRWGGI
jgi:hypothetical protein